MTPREALGSRISAQFDTYLLDTLRGYSISQQLPIEQRLFTYLMRKVSITSAHYANYAAANWKKLPVLQDQMRIIKNKKYLLNTKNINMIKQHH